MREAAAGANRGDQRGRRPLGPSSPAVEVARLERRLELMAEHLPDMIFRFEFEPEPHFDYVSPATVSISGYTAEEHYEDAGLLLEAIHPDDRQLLVEGLADPQDEQGEPLVLRWVHKDGRVFVTEQRYRLERAPDGRVVAIEGVVRDVTARLTRQAALEHDATHDPVTGLANMRVLEEQLERHLGAAGSSCVVVVLQIDRFAIIRDLVGRASAEALLRGAAERIRSVAPASSLIVKGTDDLFWLALPQSSRTDGEDLLRRVHHAFREPLTGEGRDVYLTVSAGARQLGERADESVEDVLNDADTALRAVRGRGLRVGLRWFDLDLHRRATERLALEHDLREAVIDGEVTVAYQPQHDMATGRIVGIEALARWDRPGHGPVSPATFIQVAEASGLIADLGDHVLFTATRQFARWRALGLIGEQRLSVNVSRRQLGIEDLTDSLVEIIGAAGLAPEHLTVEVTETAVMEAGEVALEQLANLVAAGARISLDDFGTGHSSLGALRDLPVHELKIDRAFVANIEGSRSDVAICSAVVALGRGLGLELVAEGVETLAQSRILQDLGCPVGQGFLFSDPLGAEDMAARLRASP